MKKDKKRDLRILASFIFASPQDLYDLLFKIIFYFPKVVEI